MRVGVPTFTPPQAAQRLALPRYAGSWGAKCTQSYTDRTRNISDAGNGLEEVWWYKAVHEGSHLADRENLTFSLAFSTIIIVIPSFILLPRAFLCFLLK